MELKAGYKQTEVGVIPEDWGVKPLGSMVKIFGGGTPSTSIPEYWGGKIPWVSAGDVSRANGRYIYETADSITELGLASSPTIVLPKGTTIIISRGATVGRMAQLSTDMAFNQTCYGLRPADFLDQDYLYYSMRFSVDSIKALTYGTIFGTITTNSFQQWLIPFPPLPEQQAIAAALSDVDTLIAALDALIAKKRNIKQGAMQELLTGKKRLAGFGGAWEEKSLDEFAFVIMGQSPAGSSYNENGVGIALINGPTEFTQKYPIKKQWTTEPTRYCEKGDILLCVRGSSTGRINIANDTYCIGRGVAAIRAKENSVNSFLEFQVQNIVDRILAVTAGSTFPNIDGKSLKNIQIELPPVPEQHAIAEILSDMDAEIEGLERKRAKYQSVKQGMMQELLTGKTRLVGAL